MSRYKNEVLSVPLVLRTKLIDSCPIEAHSQLRIVADVQNDTPVDQILRSNVLDRIYVFLVVLPALCVQGKHLSTKVVVA